MAEHRRQPYAAAASVQRPRLALRNPLAVIGIALGLLGLGIDFVEIVPSALSPGEATPGARNLFDALIWFWTYFTHLSNLGLVLVYVAVLSGRRWLGWFRQPVTQIAIGGYILLVMVYYHVMLAPLYTFEGGLLVATVILHYLAPLYYLAWWALFAPHGTARLRDIGWMLLPGLAYVGWVLLRGLVVGEYPYDILDAGKFGYGQVMLGVLALLAAVVIFCAVLIGADRLLARLRAA